MEVKDLSTIHYAPYNPRILSDHMGTSLDASMTTFGDISGITNNLQTSTLVTGHQRLRILEKRYPGRVKIYIEHRFDAPDEYGTVATGFVGVEGTNLHLSYREVSWDLGKEKAANVGANKIEASFDDQLLAELNYELSQFENGDDLLALTGQTEKEIDDLLKSVGGGSEAETPAEDEKEDKDNGKLTFALSKDQREFVERALSHAKVAHDIPHTNLDNINGTALYIICQQYVETATSQNTAQTPIVEDFSQEASNPETQDFQPTETVAPVQATNETYLSSNTTYAFGATAKEIITTTPDLTSIPTDQPLPTEQ